MNKILFETAKVNIQETQFLRGISTPNHTRITNEWTQFHKRNDNDPTAAQVADFAKYIDSKYEGKFVWPGL